MELPKGDWEHDEEFRQRLDEAERDKAFGDYAFDQNFTHDYLTWKYDDWDD